MAGIVIQTSQEGDDDDINKQLDEALQENAKLQDQIDKAEHQNNNVESAPTKPKRKSRPRKAKVDVEPTTAPPPIQVQPDEVSLDEATIEAINKLAKSGGLNMTDEMLGARIENMFRNLSSQSFREKNVTQDPFFDKLFDKSKKVETDQDLLDLVKVEQDKQKSSILNFQTTLKNQLNLLQTQVDVRLNNLELDETPDQNRIAKYEDFRAELSVIEQNVESFIIEATDVLEKRTFDVAKEGKNLGDFERDQKETDKLIKDADKKRKESEKIINDFHKTFTKYANEQKKQVVEQMAYSIASKEAGRTGTNQRQVNKLYYDAKKFYNDNIADLVPKLTEDEILGLYASEGGSFKDLDFTTIPASFSPKNRGGGVTPPAPPGSNTPPAPNNPPPGPTPTPPGPTPPGNPPTPPTPPIPPAPPGGIPPSPGSPPPLPGPTFTVGDLLNILREFADAIKKFTDVISLEPLRLGVQATSKELVNPGNVARSGGKAARATTDLAAMGAGTAIGALFGMPFVGGTIGKIASSILPIEELAEMAALLTEIAANTSAQATPFSPDLIYTKVEKQLALLEQNAKNGQQYGTQLTAIQQASNDVQLEMKKAFDEFVIMMAPIIIAILQDIKVLAFIAAEVAKGFAIFLAFMAPGTATNMLGRGIAGMRDAANGNRARRRNGNVAQQLDDNVPFL